MYMYLTLTLYLFCCCMCQHSNLDHRQQICINVNPNLVSCIILFFPAPRTFYILLECLSSCACKRPWQFIVMLMLKVNPKCADVTRTNAKLYVAALDL